ncbi:hypothetical protein ACLMJK_005691 [Lecanora helva]
MGSKSSKPAKSRVRGTIGRPIPIKGSSPMGPIRPPPSKRPTGSATRYANRPPPPHHPPPLPKLKAPNPLPPAPKPLHPSQIKRKPVPPPPKAQVEYYSKRALPPVPAARKPTVQQKKKVAFAPLMGEKQGFTYEARVPASGRTQMPRMKQVQQGRVQGGVAGGFAQPQRAHFSVVR